MAGLMCVMAGCMTPSADDEEESFGHRPAHHPGDFSGAIDAIVVLLDGRTPVPAADPFADPHPEAIDESISSPSSSDGPAETGTAHVPSRELPSPKVWLADVINWLPGLAAATELRRAAWEDVEQIALEMGRDLAAVPSSDTLNEPVRADLKARWESRLAQLRTRAAEAATREDQYALPVAPVAPVAPDATPDDDNGDAAESSEPSPAPAGSAGSDAGSPSLSPTED